MSEMTSDRWRRIRLILDEALALPDDKQTSHVRSACRNDSVLCEEVLSWIQQRADADAEEFLEAFNHEGPADIHGTDAEGSVEGCDSTHDSNTTTGPRLADSSGKTDSTSPLPLASVGSGARFEIHREYARGGLGIVFLARDNELGREVALKQMQDRYLDSATARYRFMREAEITGRLEHPGVPPVYSFGQYADGRPYYAMKLVSGESMDKAIRLFHGLEAGKPDDSGKEGNRPSSEKRGKYTSFDFKQLLTHFASLCNTIDYAHSKGYIHRDIKPENIHLGKLGETIVLDWGLAKPLHEISAGTPETDSPDSNNRSTLDRGSHHSWTQYGDVFGTPAYMSPEQAAGQIDRIGPASDIFSLGCSLYCLLVGRPPLLRRKGEPPADLLAQLQDGRWQRPRTHNHHIPKPLEAICNRAMALAPEDRYSTAGGLAEDVERWLANEPTSVWTESPFERFIRWQRRYPGLRTGILVAAAIAVISLFGLSRLGANLSQARHGASLARQETRVESARHHATALARQAERGDWLGVIEGLNSPLLEAYDDKIALELWRIEALSALNRLEETEQAARIRNEAGKQLEKWPSIDGSQPPQTCSQQRMIHAEVTSHLTSHQGD